MESQSYYNDVMMRSMTSQITSLTIVYPTVYSGTHQRKHQSSVSLAFVRGPVYSPHKGTVTRKMFPFDDVIMRKCFTYILFNRLFRRRSKKTSKLRVTGLCAGNSPGTGEFPAQIGSYAENVSIWWRHHDEIWVLDAFRTYLLYYNRPLIL